MASEKRKGIAGTAIIHFGLFLLLIFVGFKAPPPLEEGKGLLVNFGTDETGSGLIEPSPALSSDATTVPINDRAEVRKKEAPIVTQNYDNESPVIKKVDPDAEKRKKEKIEAEKIRKVELEAERVKKAQEEAEKKRIAEEQKRTNDIVSRTRNAFANARNSGTNSTSEGITGGTGNQGDPNGSVNSKVRGKNTGTGDGGPGGNGGNGISYDLAGRNFQSLPNPKYEYQGEGKVVVDINVDRNGNVIQAIPGVKGSTTLDDYLLAAAKEAALKAKFEQKPDAPSVQKGTITYNFVLR